MATLKQAEAVMAIKKHAGEEISFEEASKMDSNEVDAVFKEAKAKGMKSYNEVKVEMERQDEAIRAEPAVEKQLTAQSGIVMPAVSGAEAVNAWNAYLDLKKKIATPEDTQTIQGREFFKKSYWRKLATFFNLSVEVIEEREEGTDENKIYHFVCKATAPNGRYAVGTGTCDQMEKDRRNTIHNTRSTAETRAVNRAVSNLVGGGECSAEEMGEDNGTTAPAKVMPTGVARATLSQQRKIFAIAKQAGMEPEAMKEWVKDTCGIDSFTLLNVQQAKTVIDALQKRLDEMQSETVDPATVKL